MNAPITDPNLIAQLEAAPVYQPPVNQNQQQSSMKAPITDPKLIAQLEGASLQPPTSGVMGTLQNLGTGIVHGLQGGVNDILNLPGVSSLIPGASAVSQNAPQFNGSGIAYKSGDLVGGTIPWIAGGGALDAARGVAEGVPLAGSLARALGGSGWASTAARQGIGNTIGGAVFNPNDAAQGAQNAGEISLGLSGLGLGGKMLGSAVSAIRPQQYAEQFLQNLGGGNSLENNAQSLAQDLQTSFQKQKEAGNALYRPVWDSVGSGSIYDGIDKTNSSYLNLPKSVTNSLTPNLKTLENQFLSAPTFQNAHVLQSQMGSEIRSLSSGDYQTKIAAQNMQTAQNALRSDMQNHLSNLDSINKNSFGQPTSLAQQYNVASQNWAQNVAPYLENKNISAIATGDVTNPRNITNIFKNPEPEVQKVVDDMGPQANSKILYAELGKQLKNLTPEGLQSAISGLENKGLSSYVTPEVSQQSQILAGKIAKRNLAQQASGFALGGAVGNAAGLPMGELIGAGIGTLGSPMAMQAIQNYMPIRQLAEALTSTAKNAAPVARAGIVSNYSNGGQ